MTWMSWDVLSSVLLLAGASFACLAALGVARMQDLYVRMHAATKAGSAGAGLVLMAAAIHFGDVGTYLRAAAAILFLLMTAPVAAHMIARAAYRTGVPLWKHSVVDEWRDHRARTTTNPTREGDSRPP